MPQGTSLKRTVALAPLFFGAAHLHHLYELVSLQGRPVGQATQQVGSCASLRPRFSCTASCTVRCCSASLPPGQLLLLWAVNVEDKHRDQHWAVRRGFLPSLSTTLVHAERTLAMAAGPGAVPVHQHLRLVRRLAVRAVGAPGGASRRARRLQRTRLSRFRAHEQVSLHVRVRV